MKNNRQADQKKISILDIFFRKKEFIIFIFFIFPLVLLTVFWIWGILVRLTEYICPLESCSAFEVLLVLDFVLSAVILVLAIYFSLRFSYTFGAKRLINIRSSKKEHFKKVFKFKNPERIMFEYTLNHPYRNLWQAFRPWEESSFHNFIQTLKLFNFLLSLNIKDFRKINERFPLLKESLRIRITNLNNGKSRTKILGPTKGISFWARLFFVLPSLPSLIVSFLTGSLKVGLGFRAQIKFRTEKPFYSFSNKEVKGLCDGEMFEVSIEYKGTKGYNFKLLVK